MKHIEIHPIGLLKLDKEFDWHVSDPVSLPILDGREVRFVVEGYVDDSAKEEFVESIHNLLAAKPNVLKAVSEDLYQYYLDANDNIYRDEEDQLEIESPDAVWRFVEFGGEVHIERRGYGDEGVYVSFECGCEWEEEHGLQIVLKNGTKVCKLGPYDGHLTNSDAYDDDSLENVVYVRIGQ